jgi:hypothetical protein
LGTAAVKPPLADLRTLAAGFRDLSVKAAAPTPPPPAPAPPVAVASVARVVPTIYSGTEAGLSPAVTVRQALPPYQGDLSTLRDGVLELIINEVGDVEWAGMRTPVTPRYDQILLAAAKSWKYHPAMMNGTPVKVRKVINISIKPPSKSPFDRVSPSTRR